MVTSVTSYTGSGLRDWLLQRVTAIILALYIFFLVGYLAFHAPIQFIYWQNLFANVVFRIFSVMALFSLIIHTRVGIWTVLTDYIKCAWLRLLLHCVVVLALFGFLIWGILIMWGW